MSRGDDAYPAAFKAAVALAALRREYSTAELAARHSLPEALVEDWAAMLARHADSVFAAHHPASSGSDLLDRRELARTIAENSTQGFAMMDRNGYCIYANRAWLDMTGYSADEIGAKPLHYLVHHHHPDGRPYPLEDCPIDRALPENFDVRAHEDLFFRKDGTAFHVACAASPIFEAGEPVATVIEIRDVSEQKRQAASQRESELRAIQSANEAEQQRQRLSAFLDAAPVGIAMADANGKLLLLNRANRELWGSNMPTAEGVDEYMQYKGWWADGGPRHGQRLQSGEWALARALHGHDVENDVVEIQPFDDPGVRKTIALSARPIRDARGEVTGGVVAQVDITAQRRADEALRQADRNKDEFIAVLAHELRNPLAPIRAAVDLFKRRGSDDPLLERATEAMGRQISHITRLVDDLLDVARISRGRIELRTETCDLARIVAQTVEDYRPSVEAKGVTLRVDVPDHPVWVAGDSARLAQIIGNLLHNAVKFTAHGNGIRVSLHGGADGQSDQAVLTVQDEGVGMSRALIETLFRPFAQASQGIGRSSGGLGLGLALVKGLAQLHGGDVSAESAGPGMGSIFTVRLPATTRTHPREEAAQGRPGATGLRIVAIDDNQDALEMMGMLLGLGGHQVCLAPDGESGLEAVRRSRPDVVICDIGLPGRMNGYDVVQAIRSDLEFSATPVIAVSGYGQDSDRRRSAAAGFNAHLVKPVVHDELEQMLARFSPKGVVTRSDPAGTQAPG